MDRVQNNKPTFARGRNNAPSRVVTGGSGWGVCNAEYGSVPAAFACVRIEKPEMKRL